MLWIEAVKKYIDFEYQPQITIGNDVNCSEFCILQPPNRSRLRMAC